MRMRLTKHHGLANDFLVLVDLEGAQPVDVDLVRHACDRHRGVGADGLLRATAGDRDADVTMHLFNADGSRAEMSGNGIACLAQAVMLSGAVSGPAVRVRTDAGLRGIELTAGDGPRTHRFRTDMGAAKVGEEEPEWLDDDVVRAVRVDVGNPHLVLHVPDPGWRGDLDALGRAVNDAVLGGINVELMTPGPEADGITMVVYERGVGPTLACGTGACAVAAAAVAWDLAPARVNVHMPGGTAVVDVGDTVTLEGDVHHVADVELFSGDR
jgi:diaminopimelate epimerase